ncbi:MAG: deoxynucleoside kinase [Candidatus Kaiserbacteria bacterium]|nr:deoxynucleoside kinase [Candidatus Kaiserbacteria bacterium]
MKKGIFIVLDGNDGSGKATQARLLVEHLESENIPSVTMDFPAYDRNMFGTLIGECLAGKHGDFLHMDPKVASALYMLDRFESSESIRAALAEGKVVIADRFSSSNQIHQGGKIADENERITFLEWLDRGEHGVLQVPRPDLIVYLRVPVEISLELLIKKRAVKNPSLDGGAKDTVEEDRNYLERSHATADWLANRESNWRIVDCIRNGQMRTKEDVQGEVRQIVEDYLTSYHS